MGRVFAVLSFLITISISSFASDGSTPDHKGSKKSPVKRPSAPRQKLVNPAEDRFTSKCEFTTEEKAEIEKHVAAFKEIKQIPNASRRITLTLGDKSTTRFPDEEDRLARLKILDELLPILVHKPGCPGDEIIGDLFKVLMKERDGKKLHMNHIDIEGNNDNHSVVGMRLFEAEQVVMALRKNPNQPLLSLWNRKDVLSQERPFPFNSITYPDNDSYIYEDPRNDFEKDPRHHRHWVHSNLSFHSIQNRKEDDGKFTATLTVNVEPAASIVRRAFETDFQARLVAFQNSISPLPYEQRQQKLGSYGSYERGILKSTWRDLPVETMALTLLRGRGLTKNAVPEEFRASLSNSIDNQLVLGTKNADGSYSFEIRGLDSPFQREDLSWSSLVVKETATDIEELSQKPYWISQYSFPNKVTGK